MGGRVSGNRTVTRMTRRVVNRLPDLSSRHSRTDLIRGSPLKRTMIAVMLSPPRPPSSSGLGDARVEDLAHDLLERHPLGDALAHKVDALLARHHIPHAVAREEEELVARLNLTTFTSGSAVIICSARATAVFPLYLRSPSARERLRLPLTRPRWRDEAARRLNPSEFPRLRRLVVLREGAPRRRGRGRRASRRRWRR